MLLDRIVTTIYWQYESNPLLVGHGIAGLWLTFIIFAPIYAYIYKIVYDSEQIQIVAKMCAILVTIVYGLVVITNIYVILINGNV